MESVLFFREEVGVKVPPAAERWMGKLIPLLHELAEAYRHLIFLVLAHYRRCIHFSFSDVSEVFKDLQSECYTGLLRGILRIKEEHCSNPDRVEHYLLKVMRSHVKNSLGAMLPAARVPQSRWYKISQDEKNALIPISLENFVEGYGEDEEVDATKGNLQLSVPFPLEDVEFRHFVDKLPEPYKRSVTALLDGEDLEPPALQRLFALHALLLFKEM